MNLAQREHTATLRETTSAELADRLRDLLAERERAHAAIANSNRVLAHYAGRPQSAPERVASVRANSARAKQRLGETWLEIIQIARQLSGGGCMRCAGRDADAQADAERRAA